MSIILDALKKAQAKKSEAKQEETVVSGSASGSFQQPAKVPFTEPSPPPNKVRLVLLTVLVVMALGLFLFGKKIIGVYFQNGDQTAVTSPKIFPKAVKNQNQDGTNQADDETEDQPSQTELQLEQEKLFEKKKDAMLAFMSGKNERGKYQESADLYKKLLEKYPSDGELYNNYGLALKMLGKNEEAKNAYFMALQMKPDYSEALNNLAVIEIVEKSFNDARHHLERAVELDPNYMDANLHLALCMEKLGEVTLSKKYYQAFLQLSVGKVDSRIRVQIEDRLAKLSED